MVAHLASSSFSDDRARKIVTSDFEGISLDEISIEKSLAKVCTLPCIKNSDCLVQLIHVISYQISHKVDTKNIG